MKRLLTAESLIDIGHYRNLLEQAGIACTIKNEQLAGGIGEIPFLECSPELWVLDNAEWEQAKRLLDADRQAVQSAQPWQCSDCGETIEAQFEACWQCGQLRR